MKFSKVITPLVGLLLLSFALASCGSPVVKPLYKKMKKVGVVSVVSPKSVVQYFQHGFSAGGFTDEQREDSAKYVKEIMDESLIIIEKNLNDLNGISIIPSKDLVSTPSFKKFRKEVDSAWPNRNRIIKEYVSPNGYQMPVLNYFPVAFGIKDQIARQKKAIQEFCEENGLDGVVYVLVNPTFKDIGGHRINPRVSFNLGMFNKNGDIVIKNIGRVTTGAKDQNINVSYTFIGKFNFKSNPRGIYVNIFDRGFGNMIRSINKYTN